MGDHCPNRLARMTASLVFLSAFVIPTVSLGQTLTVQQFLQEVVGVVGTGDQLKLQVRIDRQLRDL
ncbi:MAG: hypothetical protein JWM33_2035, partial [Caulobacteraceae bacterium]|nr:hypothetical protein [Caulobacteraceae bacterium]